MSILDFEKPIAALENKIRELREIAGGANEVDLDEEIGRLEAKHERLLVETYSKLSPWQKTMVARHPGRPHFSDIATTLFTEFEPLAGDRRYGEDLAIQGGPARFDGRPVMIMGHEKGKDTDSRVKHNFGMARPEGYRKAVRLMEMAERFDMPVLTFVDTSGAYPGIGAEERGQAEAIARATEACLNLHVPMIATIVGEGGSGGAMALAAANTVMMYEHAIYSVISPEGCASILWRTGEKAQDAASALKITAQDLEKLKVIDAIVPEPVGGAHRDPDTALDTLGERLRASLTQLSEQPRDTLRPARWDKFLAMGRLEQQ
ncbi:acetyl-CoA carboxylase carboxyl transferase subunit alpha [Rhodothalassium salexigens]|uniref:acetyl-CoA carboxylase carboxyltransferase subunit alpha n=1 Tax=Rhodothalassium salexigens TaxID=1086 RepID=UPI0019137654|nr:acetyl-CoA carboxylase carboxyltransferase subunit alpha [Rhodothalassium salexigens]MBK5911179.1 acetyl-CoA carboxylase carboxyl transferase subunit alpha [Rhodothalassium salexigens]MBK5921931.1 acetyl-CoA carboxylase carboxyl transferase subunit alpha [Rhodothalassium salexigens]